MPYDDTLTSPNSKPKRIAIIGSGISGLGAAWKLSPHHQITLFESEAELGGHARTRMAGPNRDVPVDTGFMVYNTQTYPHLIKLFKDLNVESVETSMSFAVTLDNGKFEYGLTNLERILADPKNALSPKFISMIADILKFNKYAETTALKPHQSLKEMLDQMGVGDYFRQRYLYPLAGAIWSTSRSDIEAFPAISFVRFFKNHGLLSAHNGPKWRTVSGGSRVYVEKLKWRLATHHVDIRTHTPIIAAGRTPTPWVKTAKSDIEYFDDIIFACHSNQTLEILDDVSKVEQSVLSALRYRPNKVYLHGDKTHMPKRRSAWSCWVYRGDTGGFEANGSFTYWMNQLQHIPNETPVFVTLNPRHDIREDLIYDETELWHPQFDVAALNAQGQITSIQGKSNTWFCGAYTRYGFHEDGLMSGVTVADRINAQTVETGVHA